jgi:hypothetical protein
MLRGVKWIYFKINSPFIFFEDSMNSISIKRRKLIDVIFRSYEIYYYMFVLVMSAFLCWYFEYPIWKASRFDRSYTASMQQIFPIMLTIITTYLIWDLTNLNTAAQEFSISMKSLLNEILSESELLLHKLRDNGETGEVYKHVRTFPELFRISLLTSVGMKVYCPIREKHISTREYPDEIIRMLRSKIQEISKKNTTSAESIISISDNIWRAATTPPIVETEYVDTISSQVNAIKIYTLLTSLPIAFWSYFSWHLGTLCSTIIAVIIIGELQGIRTRNIYEELVISDDDCRQVCNGIEDWGSRWVRINKNIQQQ